MQCRRFHFDGSRCRNGTENIDGWCREDDCAGFIRPAIDPGDVVPSETTPVLARAADDSSENLRVDGGTVRIAPEAVDRYVEAHGGDRRAAEDDLARLIEGFAKNVMPQFRRQTVKLRHDGVVLTLSSDLGSLLDYSCPETRSADCARMEGSLRGSNGAVVDSAAIGIDPCEVTLTRRAIQQFRDAHGGEVTAAEVALTNMIEDFSMRAKVVALDHGYVFKRSGYTLVFSKDREALVGYMTNHRERTWEQVKAKVKSRTTVAKPKRSGPLQSAPKQPRPTEGDPVDLADFAKVFDPHTVYVDRHVVADFRKVAGLQGQFQDDVIHAIRAAVADLAEGQVAQIGRGVFKAWTDHHDVYWLVSADCRRLIGLRSMQTMHTSA